MRSDRNIAAERCRAPLEVIVITEHQPCELNYLVRMADEVSDGVAQGSQDSDVESLNRSRLSQRFRVLDLDQFRSLSNCTLDQIE
jgi:hypothetical protein